MFDFRIIDTPDGNQIIDRNLKTLYDSITPMQMIEYIEMNSQLYLMNRKPEQKQTGSRNVQEIRFIGWLADVE